MAEPAAYGLWLLVVLNSALFILFAFSFTHPKSKRDWRAFGGYSAFIIALFTEMYGVPLTIYLLSGWLLNRYPNLDVLTHDTGHLWSTLIGWPYDPHISPFHIASYVALAYGFILMAKAWPILLKAQRSGTLATNGPYARIRHPQYVGFILVMVGFLLQWPTLITVVMFPILVVMYTRLARREERDVEAEFGDEWRRYAEKTPRFFPNRRPRTAKPAQA